MDNQAHPRGGRTHQIRDDQHHPPHRGNSRDGREQGLSTLPHGVVYSTDPPKIYYPDGRTDGRTDGISRQVYNDQGDGGGGGGVPYDRVFDPSSDNNQHQQYQHHLHSVDGAYVGVGVRMGGAMGDALNNNNNNSSNNNNNNNNMGGNELIITDYVNNLTSTNGGVLNQDTMDSEAMSVPADDSPVGVPRYPRYRDNQGGTGSCLTVSHPFFHTQDDIRH